jgi:hypothetical protein
VLPALKVNHRTGAVTIEGAPGDWPHPAPELWIAGLHEVEHGYAMIDKRRAVVSRHVVPMVTGEARPMPPGGIWYADREPHPCDLITLQLRSLDPPGCRVRFDALGTHNKNAVAVLLERSIAHTSSREGKAGFVHPVVHLGVDCNWGRRRPIYFARFDIVEWLHRDGLSLASAARQEAPQLS